MKSLIICEGKTDVILISYYLRKTGNWIPRKKTRHPFKDQESVKPNEYHWQYFKDNDVLDIWGVGGYTVIPEAIERFNSYTSLAGVEDQYSKLVIVVDRDRANGDERLSEVQDFLNRNNIRVELENNTWVEAPITNGFDQINTLRIACLVIPFDQKGSMETFTLNALLEKEGNRLIIQSTREFVSHIDSDIYLTTGRLRIKAEFGVVMAVMDPEKNFDFIDEILGSIPWEQYRLIQEGFRVFEDI